MVQFASKLKRSQTTTTSEGYILITRQLTLIMGENAICGIQEREEGSEIAFNMGTKLDFYCCLTM